MRSEHEFDIGPASDLQKKYGWFAENWTPPQFRREVVPEHLHDLVPLAARWGISCDVTRQDAAEKASRKELLEVASLLEGRHVELYRWLYSFGDDIPDEAHAFQALLIFEMEEADGPGIPGLLDWRIAEFKRDPTHENRSLLETAYKEVQSWGRGMAKFHPLDEAKKLLDA